MMAGSKALLPSRQPPAEKSRSPCSNVLFVGFNQNYSCFVCGTESGFKVYNCNSLEQRMSRGAAGGIAIVEMLFKSNVFALVGGGRNPCYSPKRVMLYHEDWCYGELAFQGDVRAVELQHDVIVVVLEFKVYVYRLRDLKLLDQMETLSNIRGLCALSSAAASAVVLACPGQRTGVVGVKLGAKKINYFQAHESSLACLALNRHGSLLATASIRGTLVNIFRTADGTKLQELRRGSEPAVIFSMAFSANSQWLVLSSDKGTVHVFNIKVNKDDDGRGNRVRRALASAHVGGSLLYKAGSTLLSSAAATAGSSLSYVKGMIPKYFSSERSLCRIRLPKETRTVVGFGPENNTVIAVCIDGSLYKCSYDPVRGGFGQVQEQVSLTKPVEVEDKPLRLHSVSTTLAARERRSLLVAYTR